MRKLALLAALLTTTIVSAQSVGGVPLKEIDTDYLQIVGTSRMLSAKVNVEVDFGQSTKFFQNRRQTSITDADGKMVIFNSMIDAVNFMSENGFEFVQAYAFSNGGSNVYHYLMRKKK